MDIQIKVSLELELSRMYEVQDGPFKSVIFSVFHWWCGLFYLSRHRDIHNYVLPINNITYVKLI